MMNPNLQKPGIIHWAALGFLLFVAVCPAATPMTPEQVAKNWRVKNVPGNDVLLADLRPEKLFYFPGEQVRAQAVLWNRGKTPAKVDLKVWVEQGLDEAVGAQSRTVTLEPGAQTTEMFSWPKGKLALHGKAVLAELREGEKLLATGEEPFSSAKNVWEVGLAGSHPVGNTAVQVRNLAEVEQRVDVMRDHYINTFEKIFWAPDDFANMTPNQSEWFSGQGRYHENLERDKYMADYGRRIGVLPTTYGKSIGSGPAARDFIRAHPEMVYGFGGKMDYFPDTEDLSKWHIVSKPYWQACGWAMYNMNDPAVVQHGINEIMASTRQFGWAGVRFDGHFQARTGEQKVGDGTKVFTADDADRQTAANQRAAKEQIWKEFPDFVFGYNFAECMLDQRFQSQLRETLELASGGGHIMDEHAKWIAVGNHAYRRWDDFAALMVREAEQVRRVGGHLFPMIGTGAVGHYQAVFALAAGAHPNNNLAPMEFNRFATRYGSLLWGASVRNLWNPLGLVVIPQGVLWENYVREEELDSRHKRLIIHLINPPLQESAVETLRLETELADRAKLRSDLAKTAAGSGKEPDYSSVDNLPPIQLLPDKKSNIPVRLIPQALGKGWKVERALYLSADDGARTKLPVDVSDEYFWQIMIPELQTWGVLVVDLEKK